MKYVYLIRSQENGLYKIGISNKPTIRIKQLQTGNGEDLKLIESFPSQHPTKVETALHNMYASNKKRGEWFELGIDHELSFISECNRIEENINYLLKEGNEFV